MFFDIVNEEMLEVYLRQNLLDEEIAVTVPWNQTTVGGEVALKYDIDVCVTIPEVYFFNRHVSTQ